MIVLRKNRNQFKMSETNVADFLSKTISNFELEESFWDSNISNHFISRENDYFGREKLDGETITDYLQEQSKELNMKIVLIETEDLNCTMFGRPEIFEMFAIPTGLPNFLLNGTIEEIRAKRKIYEFCDVQFQIYGSSPKERYPRKHRTYYRRAINIPWIMLQRKTGNLAEYCLVPMSKLRNMPREQYFILLHFFNELQNAIKGAISSNHAQSKPEVLKMTVPIQDILANDNLKRHGEKRKMPLEDGHEDPVARPSKRMKLEKGLNEKPVFSNKFADDSTDYECPVCLTRFSSEGIPKAGFQMKIDFE